MRLMSTVRSMPYSVLGLVAVFLLVPLLSLFFVAPPWEYARQQDWMRTALVCSAYWVIPWLIAASLLWRHHWFLPLYLTQCVALTLHTLTLPGQVLQVQAARILLITLMVYVGVLFGNRNFLYPLLTKQFRLWRRSVRYRVGRAVLVTLEGSDDQIPALLNDCSNTGAQLGFHFDDADKVRALKTGARLWLLIPGEAEIPERRLPLAVAWTLDGTESWKMGCRALDRRAMKAYVKGEILKRQAAIQLPDLRNYSLEQQDIQETALILWLVCIALSFALPAFGG